MESPEQPTSSTSDISTRLRGNTTTKAVDDVASLTSFNPFSQEDEHDQSSYTLVTSLLSRVKNSLAAPLSSTTSQPTVTNSTHNSVEARRSSTNASNTISSNPLKALLNDKAPPFRSFKSSNSIPAPPVVSFIPVVPEFPTYNERVPSRNGQYFTADGYDGGPVGTAIPGFPIPDDARSIHTTASLKRSASKVIRKIRGEGLSRDYWMDDENCKECYDCKSVFTTWRRKHHCRICALGQIFCSRCASNIIPGSRFGHDGMIRICNLCLEKLHINDDEDDDRRSIISTLTSSFPTHPGEGYSQNPLGLYSHSPNSNSQFFARNEDPVNFFTIAENRRRLAASDGSGFNSRPLTPWEDNDQSFIDIIPTQAAPFRRGLGDEDKENNALSEAFNQLSSSTSRDENGDSANDRVTLTLPAEGGTSSIQFPGSDDGPQSPGPYGILRPRIDSSTDDIPTPFLRSRVQSRLGQFWAEPGWRTRRESTAYAQELNLISMFHLRVMLRQLLTAEGISNVKEWEDTLLKISLRIARDLTFTALPHRDGADMDVRRYVKIKKIPGGSPHDSEYVDGAVITKNVAHKRMSRNIRNPRVMLVAFSLDFQRVEGKYVHFGQIVLQEKEYLGNLASRIAALRPHIVLVEKSISRLVLETLEKQKITVATMVKKRAIDFVSRMTQGDTFASMDMLALEPRLGHCSHLRVQTFDHPMIPGRRKTYMRFEGCSRDLGCTIILRGGDSNELTRVKKVARFVTFIVRNLKLETHLWKDSVITLPHLTTEAVPASMVPQLQPPNTLVNSSFTPSEQYATTSLPRGRDGLTGSGSNEDDLCADDAESLRLSRRIRKSVEPYLKTFISVSATLRFAPPYPIKRMVELDAEVQAKRTAWEDDIIRKEENMEYRASLDQSTPLSGFNLIDSHPDEIPCAPSSSDISTTPRLEESMHQASNNITGSSSHSSLNSLKNTPLLPPQELDRPLVLKDVSYIALESDLDLIKRQHDEQRRIWEWYLRKNKDDFIVDKYQRISLLEFTIPIDQLTQRRSCFPPQFHYITFYGDNDCTLGQFIERSVRETLVQFLDPKAVCEGKGCNEPLARHCKVFVHNESRLIIHVEQWAKDIKTRNNLSPQPTSLTTWSACRICGSVTPFIPVSEEMSRYSFAKFLELFFYPADVQLVQGAGCAHNIYQHHIRYFAIKGMTICFQTDPITLFEVIYPPSRIKVRSQTLLQLKNMDCEALLARNVRWYSALIDDLRLINIDAASGDEESDSRLNNHINVLINRAEAECREVTRLIHKIYSESSPVDTLALNQVRAQRQDYIVAWQQDFDTLPKPKAYQLPEKETRRVSAFGSVRAMWPRRVGPQESARLASASVSEVEDNSTLPRRSTIESVTSTFNTSDISEPEPDSSTEQVVDSLPLEGVTPLASEPTETNTTSKSDPEESDSTIGASRQDITENPSVVPDQIALDADVDRVLQMQSRLPRRSGQHPSVAELVQRYQDFLPASVSSVLAVTAFPPPVPPPIEESDMDTDARPIRRRPQKTGAPLKKPARELQSSDLEGSYTANIAPRYLAHRRPSGLNSRIPGPIASSFESRESSRRTSPDKRTAVSSRDGPPSLPSRGTKQRVVSRPTNRDKIRNVSGGKPVFRRTSTSGPGNRVSNIARHFERMSRENDRANRRYAVIRGRRARPVASARATVEVLDSVREAIKDESDHSSDSSSVADDEDEDEDDGEHGKKSISLPADGTGDPSILEGGQTHPKISETSTADPRTQHGNTQAPDETMDLPSSTPSLPSYIPKPLPHEMPTTPDTETVASGSERHSTLMKALSGLWPPQLQQIRQETEPEDPLDDPEHIFRESSMIVRTDEPTSIIALALNSPQYRDMLARSRAEKRQVREAKITEGGEVFMPDDQSVSETNSTWGVVNLDATDDGNPTEDLRMPSSKSPWAISFESGGLTITCTILYPEQFDALRRTFDCERSLIESLARCVKWNANGGKSGSAFLKTRDDRFIAKELSRAELETMETFGPAYFDYMSSAFTAERPTLLAKVLGCYKLVFRKATRGKEKSGRSRYTQMNLLVMENLFYDRRFSKIFDLKGSTRNRHVQSTGQENEVLLDENLVEIAHISPFYVREHSKRILRGALYNDSRFLADINVMDYSLVVGVDNEKNELVVGIVDYIRTYTWDKKLESWVKESAFLGGAGKGEPTIITPKQYRQRFISAMERYFPLVPDRWMKQNDAPEEEGNSLLDLWPDW